MSVPHTKWRETTRNPALCLNDGPPDTGQATQPEGAFRQVVKCGVPMRPGPPRNGNILTRSRELRLGRDDNTAAAAVASETPVVYARGETTRRLAQCSQTQ
ncbi:hypothetical protein AAFF_G00166180 [Aldrovandia affinis]|uniref:Uncharacterized protein n=1 Tax=Aldrovandia affinis TaxID=143900 RepID=A0AAD7RMI9_9TELE|nr:hypothetical protein AAFF_G00166180 [Aldrovandia affinis]